MLQHNMICMIFLVHQTAIFCVRDQETNSGVNPEHQCYYCPSTFQSIEEIALEALVHKSNCGSYHTVDKDINSRFSQPQTPEDTLIQKMRL